MNLFDIFHKSKRKFIPLVYYLDYQEKERAYEKKETDRSLANPNDFPEKYFDKIIIMTRRLYNMEVYEEKEIVRFFIPKMLEFLELSAILSGVSIKAFDTAAVVFGENYAGWLYQGETKKGEEIFYTVPFQLLFYHHKKEDNYFICKTRDGLELKQNKVSVTNTEDKAHIIKNTKNAKLSKEDMKDLQMSYYVLFMYIKQKILVKRDTLGYMAFIEKFGNSFLPLSQKEKFISYAKQYFSLSLEREEFFLAYENHNFKDFLYELLGRNAYARDFSSSYNNILEWVEEKTKISIDIVKEFADHFEFLKYISTILNDKGYYLYLLIKEDLLYKTHILLSKEKNIAEDNSKFTYEIISFHDVMEQYDDELSHEREVRELAKDFYHIIGVNDIENMMMNITGNRVLDFELCKKHYLSICSIEEDMDSYHILGTVLSRYGLTDLIEEDTDIDKSFFLECEMICPMDRAVLYADLIRENQKLLYSLEAGGYFYLGIIENDMKIKEKMEEIMRQLLDLQEIENYVIYDSKEKEMFVSLLSAINWRIDGKYLLKEELRKKFYKENAEMMSKEEADRYLSRIVIRKSQMKICISNYYDEDGKEREFMIKAENGKYFTNLDLLLQLGKYFNQEIDFVNIFDDEMYISGLVLGIGRDRYILQ